MFRKSKVKIEEQQPSEAEVPLKWDIEKEYEDEGLNINSEFNQKEEKFKSFFDKSDTDNYLKNLKSKSSFNFSKKLTMSSKKNTLKRIKTAITIKSTEKNNVEVTDENGRTFKIDKNLLNKIETDKRKSSKIIY
jgi:hypothetical protein